MTAGGRTFNGGEGVHLGGGGVEYGCERRERFAEAEGGWGSRRVRETWTSRSCPAVATYIRPISPGMG
jgi:hypothetical protein